MDQENPRPKENPLRVSKSPEERYREDMLTLAYMTSSRFGSGVDVTKGGTGESQEPRQIEPKFTREELTSEIIVQQAPMQEPEPVVLNTMQAMAEDFLPSLQARKEFSEGPPPQIYVPYDIPEDMSEGAGFSIEGEGLQSFAPNTLQSSLSTTQLDIPEPVLPKTEFFQESGLFVSMQTPDIEPQAQASLPGVSVQEFDTPVVEGGSLAVPQATGPVSPQPLALDYQQEQPQLPEPQPNSAILNLSQTVQDVGLPFQEPSLPSPPQPVLPQATERLELSTEIPSLPLPEPASSKPVSVSDLGIQDFAVPNISLPEFVDPVVPQFKSIDVSQSIDPKGTTEFEIPEEPKVNFKNPYAFIDGPEVSVNPAYVPDNFEKEMNNFPDREMHRGSLDELQDATRDYLRGVDSVLNSIVEELREARSRLNEIETALDRRYSR